MYFGEQPEPPKILLRDRDSKFVPEFDEILKGAGVQVKPVGPRAPNLNAHAERFVQSVRGECLDHFIVFGEAHLRHILKEYEAYYPTARPHQGVGNVPLSGATEIAHREGPPGEVMCEERLGGLLKHYRRKAA